MTENRTPFNSNRFRLLVDPACDGPANMARDEALLDRVGRRSAPPTLRLYQWSPPTISLGYFQPFADYRNLPPPAGALPVVRRLTGGGAILHHQEITYSLTLPNDHPLLAGGPNRLYELMHDAIIAALNALDLQTHRSGQTAETHHRHGPFFCFARRHGLDVLLGSDKIAGSAQRRTRLAVLQHGSIILANPFTQQRSADPGLWNPPIIALLTHAIPQEWARLIGGEVQLSTWSAAELDAAQALRSRYLDPAWNQRT